MEPIGWVARDHLLFGHRVPNSSDCYSSAKNQVEDASDALVFRTMMLSRWHPISVIFLLKRCSFQIWNEIGTRSAKDYWQEQLNTKRDQRYEQRPINGANRCFVYLKMKKEQVPPISHHIYSNNHIRRRTVQTTRRWYIRCQTLRRGS